MAKKQITVYLAGKISEQGWSLVVWQMQLNTWMKK